MAARASDAWPFEYEACCLRFGYRIANAACRVGSYPQSDAQAPANVTAVFEPPNPPEHVAPSLFLSKDFVVAAGASLDQSEQGARSARGRGESVTDAYRRARHLSHQDWGKYA